MAKKHTGRPHACSPRGPQLQHCAYLQHFIETRTVILGLSSGLPGSMCCAHVCLCYFATCVGVCLSLQGRLVLCLSQESLVLCFIATATTFFPSFHNVWQPHFFLVCIFAIFRVLHKRNYSACGLQRLAFPTQNHFLGTHPLQC